MGILQRRIARIVRELGRLVGLEQWLFLVALLGIGVAIARTVSLSAGDGADLRFAGARDELSAIIRNRGAGGGGFAAHHRSKVTSGAQVVTVDSLAVAGDTSQLASLAKGGFLRDQIEAFNETAVRDAWLPMLLGKGGAPPTAVGSSRSLLQLARTDDGSHVISSRLNAFVLRVQAPGSESEGTLLRTADGAAMPVAVAPAQDILLTGGAEEAALALERGECAAKTVTPTERLLYCSSLAGFDVNRRYDLRVVTKGPGFDDGRAVLSRERKDRFWLNGAPVDSEVAARTGDLVFTPRLGPVAFSQVDQSRLAGPQWINGRSSFQAVRTGSLRHFARAGSLISPPRGADHVTLALDARLTRELDADIVRFVARHDDYLEDMSVVIVDLASGELKALAESTGNDKPLLAFEPLLLGSMSKPLIAAAILSQQPELADLVITRTEGKVGSVGGLPLRVPVSNPANGCPDQITFDLFLQCSSNQFAAELFVGSLQRSAGRRDLTSNGRVSTTVLAQSAVTDGILTLFDDADVESERNAGRSSRLWQRDTMANAVVDAVPRDPSLLPWVSRPWFVYPDSSGIPLDWLARFAIGGWENRWTLLGAAEAYARIATGRRVHVSVLQQPAAERARFAEVPGNGAAAFRTVRRGLARVASSGTARGLDARIAGLAGAPDSVVVMAKTGTLNEASTADDEDGVFLKALALVAGVPGSGEVNAPLRCGTAVIVYLQFRSDWIERARLAPKSRLPDLHLQFANTLLTDALGRYWKRAAPCGPRRGNGAS